MFNSLICKLTDHKYQLLRWVVPMQSGEARCSRCGQEIHFDILVGYRKLTDLQRYENDMFIFLRQLQEQALRAEKARRQAMAGAAVGWWTVLRVKQTDPYDTVRKAYRVLVKEHHPDRGGHRDQFEQVQQAWEQFERTQKKTA